MKKFYYVMMCFVALFSLIMSCTKELDEDDVSSFNIKFSGLSFESFVDTAEVSSFTITSGQAIEAGDFQIKYDVVEGAGTFAINSEEFVEGTFIDLPAGNQFAFSYTGTNSGTNRVIVTIRDQLGMEETFRLVYNVNNTAFSFVVEASKESTYEQGILDLFLRIEEITPATYEVSYEVSPIDATGSGAANILVDGAVLDPDVLVEISAGETIWQIEGVTQGMVEFEFTLTSSLGIEDEETPSIQIEIGETPEFEFSASAMPTAFTNTSVDVNFSIEEVAETSTYMMTYTNSSEGVFVLNDISYAAGDMIPVEVGDFMGQYTGSVEAVHELVYTVVNANRVPVSIAAPVSITFSDEDITAPVIDLNGPETVTVTVFEPYVETVIATDNVDGIITGQIDTGGTFTNTNRLGEFTVIYNVTDAANNRAVEVSRTIFVVDNVAPVIALNGPAEVTTTVLVAYLETATATDNFDDDASLVISTGGTFTNTSELGEFTITYDVRDANGNDARQLTRTINVVDDVAPVINLNLNGRNEIFLTEGDRFIDPATARDNFDGDITDQIVIRGLEELDTNQAGEYDLVYNVMDSSRNRALTVILTINVDEEDDDDSGSDDGI